MNCYLKLLDENIPEIYICWLEWTARKSNKKLLTSSEELKKGVNQDVKKNIKVHDGYW